MTTSEKYQSINSITEKTWGFIIFSFAVSVSRGETEIVKRGFKGSSSPELP